MTQKYFGSRNDSLQLWLYQRASLLHQAKFLTGDPTLLLVHGMDDTLVSIDHTMQLARVSYCTELCPSHLPTFIGIDGQEHYIPATGETI